ncbi:MAG: KH domain-containing protein [Herpetosiphonaceae bacterium]|nr:KH domain-containing protein [Herpetosiphonaceae bacterium]
MRSIEISARTVAEATRLALEQLGVDEDEAMIAVLQVGDEENEALVRVSVDDAPVEAATTLSEPRRARPPFDPQAAGGYARELLEGILEHMGLEGYVNVEYAIEPGPEGEDQHSIQLDVEGLDEETVGLMIGRRGETLRSLQFLLNTIVNRSAGRWPQIVVDVGNYRQRRRDSLEGLARRVAEQVRTTGRALPLEPMQSYDRRIVHMTLRDDGSVYTESNGEGENRRIVVHPRR